MIESVREHVVHMLHTHDGARVAMMCLWHGTAKVGILCLVNKYYTPCPRKKQATLIFAITSPPVEIF